MTKRKVVGDNDDHLVEDGEDAPFFIASATWQGSRPGYYFGTTGERGTGYYLDSLALSLSSPGGPAAAVVPVVLTRHTHLPTSRLQTIATAAIGGKELAAPVAAAAAAANGRTNNSMKRVRIDESGNETNHIRSAISRSTNPPVDDDTDHHDTHGTATTGADAVNAAALALLDDAERRAAGRKVVALTTPGEVIQAGLALRRTMDQNTLLRAKGGGGETYMDSEVSLYEHIVALKALAADPANLYGVLLPPPLPTTTTTMILDDLMQLLLHDNTDIAVAVTSVLLEWLDVDLVDESAIVLNLAQTLLSQRYNMAELLVDNLLRSSSTTTTTTTTTSSSDNNDTDIIEENDEDDDEVGRGTEDILSVLENLLDMEQQQGDHGSGGDMLDTAVILCRDTKLIPWLLQTASARSIEILSYITSRDEAHGIIANWGSIPCGGSSNSTTITTTGTTKTTSTTLDGIEILLQIVARFRKTQPTNAVEVELLENTAVAMAGILNFGSPASIQAFLDAQGIELVLRCLKEKVYAGFVTLKWLDFSGSSSKINNANPILRVACERAVDAGLFKYVFALFLGKAYPIHYDNANGTSNGTTTTVQKKKDRKAMNQTIQNTVIRILYALTCHLQSRDGQERRERLVAKFANEKITQRLVELLLDYDQKVRIAEYNFFKSDLAEDEEDNGLDEGLVQLAALEAKLAAGGDTLHRLSAIAAFCSAESKSIHASILALLQAKESGVSLIREALLEFLSVLDDASSSKAQIRALVKVLI